MEQTFWQDMMKLASIVLHQCLLLLLDLFAGSNEGNAMDSCHNLLPRSQHQEVNGNQNSQASSSGGASFFFRDAGKEKGGQK
jgi:hypothetical protein